MTYDDISEQHRWHKNRLKDLQREFQNGGWNASPLLFFVLECDMGAFFLRMTRVMPDV